MRSIVVTVRAALIAVTLVASCLVAVVRSSDRPAPAPSTTDKSLPSPDHPAPTDRPASRRDPIAPDGAGARGGSSHLVPMPGFGALPGVPIFWDPGGTLRPAGPPADYSDQYETLSRPSLHKLRRDAVRLEAHDGVSLYVEVVRPTGAGPWPVILEASPYHGTLYERDGLRMLPDDGGLTGYFPKRGYAVAMLDLRGTGLSEGCLDHLGPDDAADLKMVVEWAADQPWSNGRVAMIGHSYPGSTPTVAAAQKPRGLVTIVPSAGLASMYDHQFQRGVPYDLQWAGPMVAYEQLALQRHVPGGESFGEGMTYTGCGIQSSSLLAGYGQVTGQYQDWHRARDWRAGAIDADIPIFIVHGVNDDAARIPGAEWFFGGRFDRPGDKVWIGQWDHGVDAFHPNQRDEQWTYALHAWFDKHLLRADVDTGPPVEAFLNDGSVFTATGWGRAPETLRLFPGIDGDLGPTPEPTPGSVSYMPRPVAGPVILGAQAPNRISFWSRSVDRDTLILGIPRVSLAISVTSSEVLHLIATLYARGPAGQRPVSTCAIQPQLREGIDRTTPVVPTQVMRLEFQCFTAAHHLRRGERLVLEIANDSPHHVGYAAADLRVEVHTGPGASVLQLPVLTGPTRYPDVRGSRVGLYYGSRTTTTAGPRPDPDAAAPIVAAVPPDAGSPITAPEQEEEAFEVVDVGLSLGLFAAGA